MSDPNRTVPPETRRRIEDHLSNLGSKGCDPKEFCRRARAAATKVDASNPTSPIIAMAIVARWPSKCLVLVIENKSFKPKAI